MIQIRRLHRSVGLVLLLPFLGWAITGFVFFVKPGYEGAYETLQPKTYPLDLGTVAVMADPSWLAAYRRVCGLADDGALPTLAPQLMAAPLHLALLADRSFPIAAIASTGSSSSTAMFAVASNSLSSAAAASSASPVASPTPARK